MASEAAQLVVVLAARLDQFERQLKNVGAIADNEVRQIEDRFQRLNPSIGIAASAGALLGVGLAKGVDKAIEAVTDFIDRLKEIPDIAKRTGETVQNIFGLQAAISKETGLEPAEVNKGLENLSKKLNDARRDSTELSKQFELNGYKIKDAANNAIPLQQAISTIADMMRNTVAEQDKIKLAEMAGLSKEWVKALEGGSSALTSARDAAAGSVPDLQAMIDKAKQFDDAWRETAKNLGTYLKASALDFMTEVMKGVNVLRNINWGEGLTPIHRLPDSAGSGKPAQDRAMAATVAAMGNPGGSAGTPASGIPTPPQRPIIEPTKYEGKKKESGGGSESLDAFEREERRAKERAAQLEEETRSIGLNTEARTKNAEVVRLKQMLEREGLPLSDENIAKIEATATKLAKATAAYDDARQAQRQSLELQNFVGAEMINILDQIAQRGATAADVMRNLAGTLAKALLQAAILGQGPLAGLLGTGSTTPGSTGGLIGLLTAGVKAIPGFAGGTNSAPGGLAVVGEKGPELVTLPRGAQVIPNYALPSALAARGGGTVNMGGISIDARGSNITEGQILGIVRQAQAEQRAALVPLIRNAAQRGRL